MSLVLGSYQPPNPEQDANTNKDGLVYGDKQCELIIADEGVAAVLIDVATRLSASWGIDWKDSEFLFRHDPEMNISLLCGALTLSNGTKRETYHVLHFLEDDTVLLESCSLEEYPNIIYEDIDNILAIGRLYQAYLDDESYFLRMRAELLRRRKAWAN